MHLVYRFRGFIWVADVLLSASKYDFRGSDIRLAKLL
jgi:hypothetical protein